METKAPPGVGGVGGENTGTKQETRAGRKRRNGEDSKARFFLPKPGSTLKSPELGQEMTTEGEVLVQALKRDQHFYVVTAWRAVTEQNGGSPVILKQSVATDIKTD